MELARVEELFRYFRSASRAVSLTYEDIDCPQNYRPTEASLSTDLVLNALLQLVVLRLDGDRAFVSLIDDQFEFVIAEATKTISLVDGSSHGEGDELCIGTKPLTLEAGICAGTMPAFRTDSPTDGPSIQTSNIYADTTRYVINDLTAEDMYKSRPYVAGHPRMRWYAEVPLRTAAGYAIGSLAVVDNETRVGLQDHEFRVLSEAATAIMRHLELLRIDAEHNRAASLLTGLDKFMHQRPSVPSQHPQNHTRSIDPRKKEESQNQPSWPYVVETSTVQPSRARKTSDTDTTCSQMDAEEPKAPTITATGHDIHPKQDSQLDADGSLSDCKPSGVEEKLEVNNLSHTHEGMRNSTFSSASSLLRDAADLDGAIFFDIAPSTSHFDTSHSVLTSPSLKDLDKSDSDMRAYSPANSVNASGSQHGDLPDEQQCKRLGSAFRSEMGAQSGSLADDIISLPVDVMQSLLYHYPKGAIFNLDRLRDKTPLTCGPAQVYDVLRPTQGVGAASHAAANLMESSNVESKLRSCIPKSRSIIFHPLWNSRTESWYAACLAWANDSRRVLQSSDLSYIIAFSNSIMAEVVNLELLAIDTAKSDFISSISHEVRSPLHGILGSAEILLETEVNTEQRGLIQVMENCGRNLLDTMDNILQFSKINSKARGIRKSANEQKDPSETIRSTEEPTDGSNFDIGRLVEKTVEGLIVGHQHNISFDTAIYRPESRVHNENGQDLSSKPEDKVVTILRVDPRASWEVRSRSAVWQRILINLLGNAMKYTAEGCIEVELSIAPQNGQTTDHLVTLVVRDTGRGISQSYLDHHLYQPFVQEDTLSPGTGLGLSIVKGLAQELHGNIFIHSGKGVGTVVTVSIPTVFVTEVSMHQATKPLYQMDLCLYGFETLSDSETLTVEKSPENTRRTLALRTALQSNLEVWPGVGMTFLKQLPAVDEAGIIVIMEQDLELFERSPINLEAHSPRPRRSALIVLCTDHTIKQRLVYHNNIPGIFYLVQPYGPLQLVHVVTQAQAYVSRSHHDKQDSASLAPGLSDQMELDVRSEELPTSSQEKQIPKYVLLVEDNMVNLQLLVRSMQKIGRAFLTATNGRQALETYQSRSSEIGHIFMDVSMPVMNGFSATREIRAFERLKGQTRTPITMVTGLGSEAARKEAESCGSDRFIVKPVRLSLLKSLLDSG